MTKQESKEESKLKKMWKTPRGKAIIKLGMWGIFFLLLILLVVISSLFQENKKPTNPSTDIKEQEYLDIDTMFNNLKEGYQYTTLVTNNITGEITSFNGTKTPSSEEGYRESKIGIIKYSIIDGNVYQILLNERVLILDLYQNCNPNYLNPFHIYSLIKAEEPIISYKDQLKIISYPLIKIVTDTTSIKKITVEEDTNTYELTFENVK